MTNLMESIFVLILLSGLRLSLPLIFAALGGYFSEKSGVAQIGLEAFLLIGAFTAATVANFAPSVFLSFLAAGLVSVLFAQIFCLLVLKMKSHSVVVGTGMNLLAMGLIPIVSKTVFNSTGSTPTHALNTVPFYWSYLIAVVMVLISYWLSEKTIWGLQMKFAGEKKAALESVGVSPIKRQWQSISYGAFITGLGGAVLSIFMASNYSPLMSAGRGFIALAAVIFSGWNLRKSLAICFLFGLSESVQIQMQSSALISAYVPSIIVQIFPYLLTLIVLFVFREKSQAPVELG